MWRLTWAADIWRSIWILGASGGGCFIAEEADLGSDRDGVVELSRGTPDEAGVTGDLSKVEPYRRPAPRQLIPKPKIPH